MEIKQFWYVRIFIRVVKSNLPSLNILKQKIKNLPMGPPNIMETSLFTSVTIIAGSSSSFSQRIKLNIIKSLECKTSLSTPTALIAGPLSSPLASDFIIFSTSLPYPSLVGTSAVEYLPAGRSQSSPHSRDRLFKKLSSSDPGSGTSTVSCTKSLQNYKV